MQISPRWTALAGATLLALTVGCQKEDPATKDRLDKILAKLDDLEKKIDKVGTGRGAAAPSGPQPGRPDPMATYSVPIDGNPTMGPANAKVTIVEAAEFA
jgi:hypothetical protein